jgi:hypothetical protein
MPEPIPFRIAHFDFLFRPQDDSNRASKLSLVELANSHMYEWVLVHSTISSDVLRGRYSKEE